MCTSGRMNLTRGGSHQDRSKIGLHDIDEGVSDLKARMDYCEDPARCCENLNICFPAQTVLLTEKPLSLP